MVRAMSSTTTSPRRMTSAAELRDRALQRLSTKPTDSIFDPRTGRSWCRGDFDLNPELVADLAVMDPPRPAAVLVPVVARDELTVLMTVRTVHLANHGGQIAFPGGKVEPEDTDATAAAIREAREEVGLDRSFIEPLGYLDSYRTGTGFNIVPVVALVRPGFTLTIDPSEVADTFEVPFSFLMNPANHQQHSREWRGRRRYFYAMPYGDRYIWGVSAGIVKNLYERLFAE
jgi:8-oxo-dGTP pyrophosphatase MutT (NUDIX family)